DVYTQFKEYLPDGSVRSGWTLQHPNGSKETHTNYLDPHDVWNTKHVVTITEQGVEKVVFSDYPGVDVGQSRAATQSHTSAAGLVPNTWNPPDHTCGGAPTFSGTGNTELHDGTDLFGHPTFGKGGDDEPKGTYEPESKGCPDYWDPAERGLCPTGLP